MSASCRCFAHAGFEALECRHERFGHVAPAERAEAAARIGQFARASIAASSSLLRFVGRIVIVLLRRSPQRRAPATKSLINRRVLLAGRDLDAAGDIHAERPHGAIASATLSDAQAARENHPAALRRSLRGFVPVGRLALPAACTLVQK